jgi:hypothetical protein
MVLLFYRGQLKLTWPSVSLVRRGGHPPPAAFCRDLRGLDAPFDVVDRDPEAP